MNIQSFHKPFVLVGFLSVCLWLSPSPSLSIPLEMETNLSHSLPPGFKETPESAEQDTLPGKTFVMRTSEADSVPTYLTLHKLQNGETNHPITLWTDESNNAGIIGRYSGRLYGLDPEYLDTEWRTNMFSDSTGRSRPSFRTDLFLLDLRPPETKTNELEIIMKAVAKSVASQSASIPENDTQGVISAIMYLLMVTIVILVAIARR
jgi:hypothetical protein